jgi:hypothetical protein
MSVKRIAAAILLSLCCPLMANAVNLTVNCNASSPVGKISNVLRMLIPAVPNTITVSGTCRDNLIINGFDRLSLIAKPGAVITDASGGQQYAVIQITDSRGVLLQGFTISGGQAGVMCYDFSLCRFSGNTIKDTAQRAVDIATSEATFSGDSLVDNSGIGLFMTGSNVTGTNMTIQNNGRGGVNASAGVLTGVSWDVSGNAGSGVFGSSNLHFQLIDSRVQNNAENGIQIVALSDVSLVNNLVSGNGISGLWLADHANAWLAGGAYSGNHGYPDIGCFGQYTIAGNLSGTTYGSTNCGPPAAATAAK